MSKTTLPHSTGDQQKEKKALVLLTDKQQAALGNLKCQHCRKWTKQLGANAVVFIGKTPALISFCVSCAQIYETASPEKRREFQTTSRKNLFESLAGKKIKIINEESEAAK